MFLRCHQLWLRRSWGQFFVWMAYPKSIVLNKFVSFFFVGSCCKTVLNKWSFSISWLNVSNSSCRIKAVYIEIYSVIPLLRPPKIKNFFLLKTFFAKLKIFLSSFSTHSVPLIRDHFWDCPKSGPNGGLNIAVLLYVTFTRECLNSLIFALKYSFESPSEVVNRGF